MVSRVNILLMRIHAKHHIESSFIDICSSAFSGSFERFGKLFYS